MKNYIRDLDDGTVQRVKFENDPGVSTPQWRLDETPRNKPSIVKTVVAKVKKPKKRARK